MVFPEGFFEAEERDGFRISPMMKRNWAVQLEIIEFIAKVCRKHGIKWYAEFGTLLGAVRHKGYVPWDDDVDITMFRNDYEKFMARAGKDLPKGWHLFNGRNEANPTASTLQVINTDVVCIDPEHLERYHGYPYIGGVDIFPLDNIPDDPDEREVHRALYTLAYYGFYHTGEKDLLADIKPEIKDAVDTLTEAMGTEFDPGKPIKPQFLVLSDQIAASYKNDRTKEVADMQFFMNKDREHISRKAYQNTIMMPFEMIKVPVPEGYDEVLRAYYGNSYMTPKRFVGSTHEYPCYAKAERKLREYFAQRNIPFPAEFED